MFKLSNRYKRIIIVAVAALLTITLGGVMAKYVHDNGGTFSLSSKEFYFTSDLLKESTAKYVLNAQTTEIAFTLANSADELRYSEDDIQYSVTVERKNAGALPTVTYSDGERVLKGGGVDKTTVTLQNLERGETYTVTVTGRAGYKQTLSAEFVISDNEENVYKYLDTQDAAFVLLTVWTDNVDGSLIIETNKEGLIPDNTDPALRSASNYKDGVYKTMVGEDAITDAVNFTAGYSSYTYRFFISEGGGYTADDFNVFIEKDGTKYPATKKTPD